MSDPYTRERSIPCDATHLCRFYYNNQGRYPFQLAIETWHRGTTSKDIELEVGLARKDIGYADVVWLKSDSAHRIGDVEHFYAKVQP